VNRLAAYARVSVRLFRHKKQRIEGLNVKRLDEFDYIPLLDSRKAVLQVTVLQVQAEQIKDFLD